jgi:predicted O-methyltransferase YrrM
LLVAGWNESGFVLKSVNNDADAVSIVKKHLDKDPSVGVNVAEEGDFLESWQDGQHFDLIFVDTAPGKYNQLEFALNLLNKGYAS